MVQTYFESDLVLTYHLRLFYHHPKVQSAFIALVPKAAVTVVAEVHEAIVAAAFLQRRKMLRTALKGG